MSRRMNTVNVKIEEVKKRDKLYRMAISGKTQSGKTYAYLDLFNDKVMDGKNMYIIITDTVTNITDNIMMDEYSKFMDRIKIMKDEKGNPIRLTPDVVSAEKKMSAFIEEIKKDDNVGCIVLDNYNNVEFMYLEAFKKKNNADKIMSYDYGIPRRKVYNHFIAPLFKLAEEKQCSLIVTSDVVEIYSNGAPTGQYKTNIPYNLHNKFSEMIYFKSVGEHTSRFKYETWIHKWKGINSRNQIMLKADNKLSSIITEVESK